MTQTGGGLDSVRIFFWCWTVSFGFIFWWWTLKRLFASDFRKFPIHYFPKIPEGLALNSGQLFMMKKNRIGFCTQVALYAFDFLFSFFSLRSLCPNMTKGNKRHNPKCSGETVKSSLYDSFRFILSRAGLYDEKCKLDYRKRDTETVLKNEAKRLRNFNGLSWTFLVVALIPFCHITAD